MLEASRRTYLSWNEYFRDTSLDTLRDIGGPTAIPFFAWAFEREGSEAIRWRLAGQTLMAHLRNETLLRASSAPVTPEELEALLDPCNAPYSALASQRSGTALGQVLSCVERFLAGRPAPERIATYRRLVTLVGEKSPVRPHLSRLLGDAALAARDYDLALSRIEEVVHDARARGSDAEVRNAMRHMEEIRLAWQQARGEGALQVELVELGADGSLRLRVVNTTGAPLVLPTLGSGKLLAFADVLADDGTRTVVLAGARGSLSNPTTLEPGADVEVRLSAVVPIGDVSPERRVQVRLMGYPGPEEGTWVGAATSRPMTVTPE